MKLLFDATELSYFYDKSGHRAGVFNVALNIYKELSELDVDITFYCNYKRYYFLKNMGIFKDIPILEEKSFINKLWGLLIYYTDKFPIRFKYAILILSRFYDKYFYLKNRKNSNQLKEFDVYFSPYTPPSKEIRDADIKRFRMIHDVIPIIEHGMPKTPKDWYYQIYKTINGNDFYFFNSEHTKNDTLKYFPFVNADHTKITYLGFNEKFYPIKDFDVAKKYGIDSDYVFSLCTLGKRKNLIFGIKNFFKFIKKNNIEDLKLVLAGGIWKKFEKELKNSISNFDESKIRLLGYVDDDDLPKLYSNALFFIFPSKYEGFGLPVLEAMACGCPTITSNTSSLPEVIGETGIQVNPNNDEEMVQAYERMYFDNIYRALCSERGLERAKMFSWKICAKNILDFIQEKTM